MTTDRQRAQEHLADAIEAHEQLLTAYAFQPRDFGLIGRLKGAERFHLGAAQVYATLAVGEVPTSVHHHHAGPPIVNMAGEILSDGVQP